MKKLSTLTKSAIIALSIISIGTVAIASGQIPAISNAGNSEAVAIAKSKISLEQAITIAQKTVKGDVISAEFEQNDYIEGGKFEIKSIANNTEYEVKIDASTGRVLKTKQEKLDQQDIAEYNAIKQAQISLTQALQKSTQSISGKVIEAEFDLDNGKSIYEIKIAKGTEIYQVIVDAMTGAIISKQLDN
ncbi:PepSY domain-containing protein [Psychrobacter urativorans]|uniref:PepSY domain-containing protein n=1 Tax=Psychrobacter urativorans TaxID=45610 RepID=UPI0019187AC2|nr:PepSY domain-containing protein [Psychrobacter urativorans]